MSDGYCGVDFTDYTDDADPVEFYTTKTVKARKPHTCSECRAPIAKGESYQRTNYKFEGKMGVDYVCAPCAETRAEFNHNVFGGELWANMRDQWEQGAHIQSCIQRLETARAKEHMRRQWLKWKRLNQPASADAVDPADGIVTG